MEIIIVECKHKQCKHCSLSFVTMFLYPLMGKTCSLHSLGLQVTNLSGSNFATEKTQVRRKKKEKIYGEIILFGTASEFIRKIQMDDETILRKKCQILSCFSSLQNNQRRQLVYKLNFSKCNYENLIRFWGFVIINQIN